jgi:hypothetical protein
MKTISVFVSILLFSTFSFAQDFQTGTFVEPTQTFVISYMNEADCSADSGSWDNEMEMCFFDVENEATVSKKEEGLFLDIVTTGSNAHSCWFEGPVTSQSENTLVSAVEAMVWNGDDWTNGTCEVTVTYEDADTVNVSTNGQCQEFCGARAWLEMGPAIRK